MTRKTLKIISVCDERTKVERDAFVTRQWSLSSYQLRSPPPRVATADSKRRLNHQETPKISFSSGELMFLSSNHRPFSFRSSSPFFFFFFSLSSPLAVLFPIPSHSLLFFGSGYCEALAFWLFLICPVMLSQVKLLSFFLLIFCLSYLYVHMYFCMLFFQYNIVVCM